MAPGLRTQAGKTAESPERLCDKNRWDASEPLQLPMIIE